MVYNLDLGVRGSAAAWFKTKWFKFTLTALAIVAVILVVLFNQQIGNLLKFFGSRAANETGNASLQGSNSTAPDYFLANGFSASEFDPATGAWVSNDNAVKVDEATNRLMIN